MFTHLHVHSDASKIDGLGPVDRLVNHAAKLGFTSLALTDHGTLSNSISFTMSCERHNIKPIMGLEAYVSEGGDRYHLTLLADGVVGFNSLVELNNAGMAGEDATRPTFPIEKLFDCNAGVYVLTGCPASYFQKAPYPDALRLAERLKEKLNGRLFAETQFIAVDAPWERSLQLSKDLHIPPVVTNDVHFPMQNDWKAHQALTQLKSGFTYDDKMLYLATQDEMLNRVKSMAPEFVDFATKGIKNSGLLADKLGVVKFASKPHLPEIKYADALLEQKCWDVVNSPSFATKVNWMEYAQRLTDEINVIKNFSFESYFLILQDILSFARSNNIRIGPGRGSGAGSLVCFLLGITQIDPIKYNLSFERFLNYKRAEMPDIDSDIASNGRDRVLQYAKDKWGALPVATYSRYSHKSLVHDLARIYHVDKKTDEEAADNGFLSPAWDEFVKKAPDALGSYTAMLGQIRHMGQHAGGVVIVDSDTHLPLERTSNGDLVVAWTEGLESRELSYAGLVKFDLLGLTALDVLDRLEKKYPGVTPEDPTDDHPIFEMFRKGNTNGVFQFFGSPGIIDFTKKVKPRCFEDLVAINAMYRPGSLDAGTGIHFPEWRKKPRLIHPLIDDILKPTAGIIAYQEQFMSIYARVTGEDFAGADIARKILVKSNPGNPEWEEKLSKLRAAFLTGWDDKIGDHDKGLAFWNEIQAYTRYGFNRSHAVSYTYLSWCLAWWKWNYPLDFYAETLSVDRNSWETILYDVVAEGFKLSPPNVQYSTGDFVAKGDTLYLPLNIVKHIGEKGIQAIVDGQPYESIEDFMKRVPKRQLPKRGREGLYKLGGFDGVGISPDDYNKLGLDDYVHSIDERITQMECMGFAIPDQKLIDKINHAVSAGYVAGIIHEIEEKKSAYGPYMVFKLYPEGSFWHRGDKPPFNPGDCVKAKVKTSNNKLISVTSL